jgi:hypothetical protein
VRLADDVAVAAHGTEDQAGFERLSGFAVNAALRLSIVFFTFDALINAHDQRYEGKNLGSRNLIILVGFSLLFPALQLVWKKWEEYPIWFDNLYLSLFWMDMLGNYMNWFERYENFDLWPHFYGPAALVVVLAGAFELPAGLAWVATMLIHALLELQEWLGDVLMGTHNVRGLWDTAHDLAAGLVGATLYIWVFTKWHSPKKHPPENGEKEQSNARKWW